MALCAISSPYTVDLRQLEGTVPFESGLLHDSVTAWPWHHTHYLGGVLIGLPDTSSSALKIPQMNTFFVFERERHAQKIRSVLWITVLQISAVFWQTGGSQLFLDCLVGAVFMTEKKSLMKEWHLQFFQMAEEVRMNNSRGRKMLISKKRHGHDLMLLEVVFKPRKHQCLPNILLPSLWPPQPLQCIYPLVFLSHSVSQQ